MDDNLWKRGCTVVSICNICERATETSMHLFCECFFANLLWNWFSSIIGLSLDTSSIAAILSIVIETGPLKLLM